MLEALKANTAFLGASIKIKPLLSIPNKQSRQGDSSNCYFERESEGEEKMEGAVLETNDRFFLFLKGRWYNEEHL